MIARNSTFAYKGRRACDVKQVARELGVRYVLEGSVRKAGNRIRATAQLIEAETGNHLWAERFDRDLADIFALQDEITQSVVGRDGARNAARRGSAGDAQERRGNLDAFDCWMRGVWHFHQLSDPEEHRQAEAWFRRAIELDPNSAQGHMLWRDAERPGLVGMEPRHRGDLADGYAAATRAVALDDRDPYSHYALSLVSMLRAAARAVAGRGAARHRPQPELRPRLFRARLGPHSSRALRRGRRIRCCAASASIRTIRRPDLPSRPGAGALPPGHYEEALRYAERALPRRRLPFLMRTLLATLGQLGRSEEAAIVRAELEQFDPRDAAHFWEAISPYTDPAHHAHLREGLRKAGMTQEEVRLIGG